MLKSGTKNLGIIEAINELKEISLSDRLQYEHEMRLKAKRDRHAEEAFIRKQGIEQGIEIGKSQSLSIFINYMRKNGLSDEQIVEALMAVYELSREDAAKMI